VDAEFAGQSLFGERTAHVMLIFTIAFAQWLRQWSRFPMPDAGIAGHLNDKIRILAPVKIGDTLRCRYKTIHQRISKSRPELGLVTFGLQVINQKNEAALENSVIMMIPSNSGTITG
jgi:acyl dehydratase